ncbi:TolC family protein [Paludibacterium sp. B53371]|nr:TolC family protein [Paludibacterium sp. B53371]
MAAEHKLRAEGARLDQAYANQWPKLYLDALFGREALTLNNVSQVPVRFSQIGLTFTLPIFSGGRIQAAIDAQTAREQTAWLDYRRQILAALEDVENSLTLRQDEARRLHALTQASEAQNSARHRADALLAEGQIDQSGWLDTERARLAAELARTDSLVQAKLDLIQLYKAMGGGWPATAPSKGSPQS